MGTFSKTVMPALRISYLGDAARLRGAVSRNRRTDGKRPAGADAKILAAFMGEGHFSAT